MSSEALILKTFFFSLNLINIFISCNENIQISLVLRTRANTDVFIILDENVCHIHYLL